MGIGELNQTDLHDQLKQLYCGREGQAEAEVDGYVVDVLLPSEIVEIQTRHLVKLKDKVRRLRDHRCVRLVHPVAAKTQIVRLNGHGEPVSSRRSPKRGTVENAFREITAIADILPHPNTIVEVVLTEVTEYRRDDGMGSWRRRGVSIVGRRLERIVARREFRTGGDFVRMLPQGLPEIFTNRDVVETSGWKYAVAQPVTSSLRKMGLIEIADKQGNAISYRLSV